MRSNAKVSLSPSPPTKKAMESDIRGHDEGHPVRVAKKRPLHSLLQELRVGLKIGLGRRYRPVVKELCKKGVAR